MSNIIRGIFFFRNGKPCIEIKEGCNEYTIDNFKPLLEHVAQIIESDGYKKCNFEVSNISIKTRTSYFINIEGEL